MSLLYSPLIESRKLINIHAIGDRAFHVYAHSVCSGNYELFRTEDVIEDSCICNQTLALVLSSSTVIVLDRNTLIDPECNAFTSESFGIYTPYRKRIAASANGKYVMVSSLPGTAYIYECIRDTQLMYRVVVDNLQGGLFQITGDTVSYIWELSTISGVFYLAVSVLKSYTIEKIAEFPLQTSGDDGSGRTNTGVQLLSYENRVAHGVLVRVNNELIYVSLRSISIGNLVEGAQKLYSNSLQVCKVGGRERDGDDGHEPNGALEQQIYTWDLSTRTIMKLDAASILLHFVPIPCRIPSVNGSRVVFTVIRNTYSDEPGGYLCIYSRKYAGRTHDFAVDTRKLPWKVIALDSNQISLQVAAAKVKYLGKISMPLPVSRIGYVPQLGLLLLSTIDGSTHCLAFDQEKVPHPNSIDTMQVIAAGSWPSHNILVLVSPNSVEFRQFDGRVTKTITSDDLILEAMVVDNMCILRYFDHVDIIRPDYYQCSLVSSMPTSFIHYNQHNTLLVGVDTTLQPYRDVLDEMVSEREMDVTRAKINISTKEHPNIGSVLCFENMELTNVYEFNQLPTAMHFTGQDSFIVIFAGQGPIYSYSYTGDEWKLDTKHVLSGPLKIGATSAESGEVVVIGFGMWVVTSKACRRLYDSSEKSRGFISGIEIINKGILACVSKHDVRFFSNPLLGHSQLPLIMKSIDMPPPAHSLTATSTTSFKSNRYRILLVPSKRLVILYGGVVCSFYDSATLEPLLVSGLHVSWCSTVQLWNFEEAGTKYEHVVFTDGLGALETYTLRRQGQQVECSCKFRAAAFIVHESNHRFDELLCFADRTVVIARRNQVAKLTPSEIGGITSRVALHSSISSISCVLGKYIAVTNGTNLDLLDTQLFTVCRFHASDLTEKDPGAVFVTHASTARRGENGLELVIIVGLENIKAGRYYHNVISYEPELNKATIRGSSFNQFRNDDLGLREIRIAPGYEDYNWEKNTHIVAFGVTRSYRIELLQFPEYDRDYYGF